MCFSFMVLVVFVFCSVETVIALWVVGYTVGLIVFVLFLFYKFHYPFDWVRAFVSWGTKYIFCSGRSTVYIRFDKDCLHLIDFSKLGWLDYSVFGFHSIYHE